MHVESTAHISNRTACGHHNNTKGIYDVWSYYRTSHSFRNVDYSASILIQKGNSHCEKRHTNILNNYWHLRVSTSIFFPRYMVAYHLSVFVEKTSSTRHSKWNGKTDLVGSTTATTLAAWRPLLSLRRVKDSIIYCGNERHVMRHFFLLVLYAD